jgi:hypothetical protein
MTSQRTSIRTIGTMTLVVVVLCALAATMRALTMADFAGALEIPTTPARLWRESTVEWLPWCVCAPAIAFLAVRFRPRRSHWIMVLTGHVIGAGIMIIIVPRLQAWAFNAVMDEHLIAPLPFAPGEGVIAFESSPPPEFFSQGEMTGGGSEDGRPAMPPQEGVIEFGPMPLSIAATSNAVPYLVFVSIIMGLMAFAELKSRDAAEAQLRSESVQAQLASLRMQVNPHFLFNTLNSVSAMVTADPVAARKMLSQLSELLRVAFRDLDRHEVPLSEEVALTKTYVDVQQVRFDDRFQVEFDVEEDVRNACVPVLCLQPLLENVCVHAVEGSTQPCAAIVRARRDGEQLLIDVTDDGQGARDGLEDVSHGVGLANTTQRIQQLYGTRGGVEAGGIADGGFRVRLTFPLRMCEEDHQRRWQDD